MVDQGDDHRSCFAAERLKDPDYSPLFPEELLEIDIEDDHSSDQSREKMTK